MHIFDPRTALLWAKQSTALFSPLSLNVLREVNSYLQPLPLLPCLDEQTLTYYHCHTDKWGPSVSLGSCIQFSFGSRWVCCGSDEVVLCGGGDECEC